MHQKKPEGSVGYGAIAQVFGPNLDAAMRERRMSNAELARRIGALPATVSEWRRGAYAPFKPRMRKVAEALGVTESYLMGLPVRGRHALPAKAAEADAAPPAGELFGGAEESGGGEEGGRLCLDLDEVASRQLSLAAELYGETAEQVAARILQEGLAKEFRALDAFCGGQELLLREALEALR